MAEIKTEYETVRVKDIGGGYVYQIDRLTDSTPIANLLSALRKLKEVQG